MKKSRSRRRFLRGAAGATLALPFFRSLGHADASGPCRLITLYMPQNETEGFLPSGSGRSYSFEGSYLEALGGYEDRSILITNMLGKSGHQGGHCEHLTGFGGSEDFRALGGPSIDQLLAERLRGEVAVPWLGMVSGSERFSSSRTQTTAWSGAGLPIPLMYEPRVAFERAFGPIGGAPMGMDEDRTRLLQGSLLDSLLEDYRRLESSLSAEDRRLLDAHATLLREQERRLQDTSTPITCDTPLDAPPETDTESWSSGNVVEKVDHFIDITARAFACDTTRISTMMWANMNYGVGISASDFHEIAHKALPNSTERHFEVRAFTATRVRRLLDALDSIPEGDGSVLDNTIVMWTPELGIWESDRSGNSHSRARVPALLVGGGGGFLDTGKTFDAEGARYSRLLLTLVHAMGATDISSIGDDGTGVLAGLMA